MRWMWCVLAFGLVATPAWARVKLITLPVRDRVEVQLDHADATLVEEQRVVPLVAGVNQVDFSWVGTRIDPHTIVFRVLGETELDVALLFHKSDGEDQLPAGGVEQGV